MLFIEAPCNHSLTISTNGSAQSRLQRVEPDILSSNRQKWAWQPGTRFKFSTLWVGDGILAPVVSNPQNEHSASGLSLLCSTITHQSLAKSNLKGKTSSHTFCSARGMFPRYWGGEGAGAPRTSTQSSVCSPGQEQMTSHCANTMGKIYWVITEKRPDLRMQEVFKCRL